MAGRVQPTRPEFPVNRQIAQNLIWIFVYFAGLTFPELGYIIDLSNEREVMKMATITIKKSVDVEALVCDYFEHINSGYYFGSPEDFLEARLIDILWDCGG